MFPQEKPRKSRPSHSFRGLCGQAVERMGSTSPFWLLLLWTRGQESAGGGSEGLSPGAPGNDGQVNSGSCLSHWKLLVWMAQVKLASHKDPGVEFIPVQGINGDLRPGPVPLLSSAVFSGGWECLGKQQEI